MRLSAVDVAHIISVSFITFLFVFGITSIAAIAVNSMSAILYTVFGNYYLDIINYKFNFYSISSINPRSDMTLARTVIVLFALALAMLKMSDHLNYLEERKELNKFRKLSKKWSRWSRIHKLRQGHPL